MKVRAGEKVMGFCRLWLVVLIAGILSYPLAANAEDLVSGHYINGGGREIKIELVIGSPAPPLVIVSQKIPKGVKVLSAIPELKKYAPDKGIAKWLLNKVEPGKMIITMQLDRPVAKDEISGEIMSRNRAGKLVSIALKN